MTTLAEEDSKMLLYHGTGNRTISTFDFEHCKKKRDFGLGVYFSSNYDQAVEWSCHDSAEGAVYVCDLDLSSFSLLELKSQDDDLFYILYLCRIDLEEIVPDSVDNYDKADIIAGPLLDGKMTCFRNIAEQFNGGDISANRFIGIVRHKLFNSTHDQYCIKTKRALDAVNASIQKVIFTERTTDGVRTAEQKKNRQTN